MNRSLLASLPLARSCAITPDLVPDLARGLARAGEQLHALPPWGALADLDRLLSALHFRGLAARDAPPEPPSDRLRRALLAYEHHLLARLLADPLLIKLKQALSARTGESARTALAAVSMQILDRCGGVSLFASTDEVRRLGAVDPEGMLFDCFAVWREHPAILDDLAASYEALVRGARALPTVLTEADVFLAEHIDVLARPSQRLAAAQVWAISDRFAEAWPARVRIADRAGWILAPAAVDDAYPMGGFSGIGSRGPIENLVPSELGYIEESADWDLFDLRHAEGELLFFVRDEAVLARCPHRVLLYLDGDLIEARVKDEGQDYQRVALVLGMVHAIVRRLSDWLSDEQLVIRVVFAPGLDAEAELLELTTLDARARGIITIDRDVTGFVGLAATHQGALARLGLSSETDFGAGPRDWASWVRAGLDLLKALCAGDPRLRRPARPRNDRSESCWGRRG